MLLHSQAPVIAYGCSLEWDNLQSSSDRQHRRNAHDVAMLMCRCIPVTLYNQAERGELAWPVADEWLARGQAACLPVELALQVGSSEGGASQLSVFTTYNFASRASLGKVFAWQVLPGSLPFEPASGKACQHVRPEMNA